MKFVSLFIALALVSSALAEEHKYLKSFPDPEEGFDRFVVVLPEKTREEETRFRVEIIVGKVMETDGVNKLRLGGRIESKPLKGWGFTFYRVDKFGPAASTLIGVPPGTPKVNAFVSIPSITIAYNSRVPLVVYVPKGGEVRYRIWTADETTQPAKKG